MMKKVDRLKRKVEVFYGDYKQKYGNFDVVENSYDKTTKKISLYINTYCIILQNPMTRKELVDSVLDVLAETFDTSKVEFDGAEFDGKKKGVWVEADMVEAFIDKLESLSIDIEEVFGYAGYQLLPLSEE